MWNKIGEKEAHNRKEKLEINSQKQAGRQPGSQPVSQSRDGSCQVNYDIKQNDDGMLLSGPLLQIN